VNYSELPLDERIEKAAEYALLLIDDEKPDIDILPELQTMFLLSEEQAKKAYELMRSRFNQEYQQATNTKINRAWVATLAAGVIGGFYLFSSEAYGLPWLIIALFFGLIVVNGVTMLPKLYRERKNPPGEYFRMVDYEKQNSTKKKDDFVANLPAFFMFMTAITCFVFVRQCNVINTGRIITINNLQVAERVVKLSDHARHPSYYYLFHFAGYPADFKLNQTIYRYSAFTIFDSSFYPGLKVNIEIDKDDVEKMRDKTNSHHIDLLNIGKYDYWLIDQNLRNELVKKEDRKNFLLFGGLFLASCVISFVAIRYRRLRIKQVEETGEGQFFNK
jgi:hypothetical protein